MARKVAIPKRIAGIKIPKQIRKGPLASLIASPAGQILLAQLLVIIGGAIATAANPDTRTGRALRMAIDEGMQGLSRNSRGRKSGRDFSREVGDGIVRGMEAFRQAMRESEGSEETEEVEVRDVGPGAKKKPGKRSSVTETHH